jgi:hypothetical protein
MFNRNKNTTAEKVGRLDAFLTFYAPTTTPTAHRGLLDVWVPMADVKGNVAQKATSATGEVLDADRMVAINSKLFIVRSLSARAVSETWCIKYLHRYYQIQRIEEMPDGPRRMYLQIEAQRRDDDIIPIEGVTIEPGTSLMLYYSQRFTNITAAHVTISAGTLPDTATVTEARINQLLYVFRSGQRMTYGSSGSDGYTINNATNRISFNLSLEAENVLVNQYALGNG